MPLGAAATGTDGCACVVTATSANQATLTQAAVVPAAPAAPPAPPVPASDDAWVSVHDDSALWELTQQTVADETAPARAHPDAQPAPPGVLDLPLPVLVLAAHDEAAAARAATTHHRAPAHNSAMLRALWPLDCRRLVHLTTPSSNARQPPSDVDSWSKLLSSTSERRLIVLCGGSLASVKQHAALLEHTPILVLIHILSDEACNQRGGCDSLVDLWGAMESRCPLILLNAQCSTRRARKQLLHRLSKQSVAAHYTLQALALTGADPTSLPTLEEGWASVL